jgi:oligosaccharyltransferase complex subunit gamma
MAFLTQSSTDKAEPIHAWLSRHLPDSPHPPVQRPINYVKIVTVTTAVVGVFTFLTVAAPYLLPIIQNRNLWAAISLIAVLLFTSGHMFNHIRKVPYVQANGKGGVSYFAGGFQNQFGLETQIVAAMCKFSCSSISRQQLIEHHRRHPLFRHHQPGTQGSSHCRLPQAADCSLRLGSGPSWHVLVPLECIQDQERWLPLLAAAFLISQLKFG